MQNGIYRAKRKDTGEWVEGYYAKPKDYLTEEYFHVIFPTDLTFYPHSEFSSYYEIIPETLGRLLEEPCWNGDRYGQRFFQNDIIAVYGRHDNPEKDDPYNIAIVIDESTISFDGSGRWFPQDTRTVRIIGNAYDNPELLKGHAMNRFINGLHEYPGTPSEYLENHHYLSEKYDIHGAHACCYMCNFENDYICHQYNGGCQYLETCQKIRHTENKE